MTVIVLTKAQRAALVALQGQVDAALGYPRPATLANRVGGGAHVPLAQAGTTTWAAVIDSIDGNQSAYVVTPEAAAAIAAYRSGHPATPAETPAVDPLWYPTPV